MPSPTLAKDGAQHAPAALTADDLIQLETACANLPQDQPGLRLSAFPELRPMLGPCGAIGRHAAATLGAQARPVRAILFDKTASRNWSLAWHQDRVIAVREKIETPGFGPWTVKSGLVHVAPPQPLLDRMITLRVHLDPVGEDNAPLLIARGSHRHGRIPEEEIPARVARSTVHACLAERSDIWLYATPILHASEAAHIPTRRRVLQIDYSADELPSPLAWLGI